MLCLAVCFISAHPNSANHFAKYVQVMEENAIPCKVIAEKNVARKFDKLNANLIELDAQDLKNPNVFSRVKREIASESVVIIDIANEQWENFHREWSRHYPSIKKVVYYDNPESYVPGEYSKVAASLIAQSQSVMFANASLVKTGIKQEENQPIDLRGKELFEIGYYPKEEADKIISLRSNVEKRDKIKFDFLKKRGIAPSKQKIFVYVGGANKVYYERAFPHFLQLLADLTQLDRSALENTIIILQQHPRAKKEGNQDVIFAQDFLSDYEFPKNFHFEISNLDTLEALALADGVFYYQTSMAAQFAFAQIPLVAQIGHEMYLDTLVRGGFPSVTQVWQLKDLLKIKSAKYPMDTKVVEEELGIDANWKENLLKICE